jgi:hypothetical protein
MMVQSLRPSMHLVACTLARPCISRRPTTKGPIRIRKIGFKPRLNITKAADEFDAQLEKDINESTIAVDDMVQEISKNLFIDTATAYVVGRFWRKLS